MQCSEGWAARRSAESPPHPDPLFPGDPAELLGKKQMGHFLVRSGFAAGCRYSSGTMALRHFMDALLSNKATR